jgi:hypothetical protein
MGDTMWKKGVPVPYKEEDDPNVDWKKEFFEDKCLLSTRNFITDCIYTYRGRQVSAMYIAWSILFVLSTVIKREAWINWADEKMYANLYVLLVGPAGIAMKGTAIGFAQKLLPKFNEYIDDESWAYRKNVLLLRNKATPEYIIGEMVPAKKAETLGVHQFEYVKDKAGRIVTDKEGNPVQYQICSEAALILRELAVMLTKKSYAEDLVDVLTDLYDPDEYWDAGTRGRGRETLYRHYLTMIGGTTPTGFKDSIPKTAAGDGFLSRVITVYSEGGINSRPEPLVIDSAPDVEELAKRLAWIAKNVYGEYTLSDEAKTYYYKWYNEWQKDLKSDPNVGVNSRLGIHLLQVAFLLRAAQYKKGNVIELSELRQSEELLKYTASNSRAIIAEIQGGDYIRGLNKVEDYIKKKMKVRRRPLMQAMKEYNSYQINEFLRHALQSGTIRIYRDGKSQTNITTFSEEEYRWVIKGGSDEREEKELC